ncbi:MarR family transcriptional regulator [Pleionea sp. CnH1-48]|uniref:MarR family transcriptional regulator n=1 Tax=Pleionea sp. CnH1-48 TaxID=2954494 RepID=UPI0020976D8E|nr:MarR family transcriptional regulator [Pleionea sp. CnH1-48]MCO7223746.1 MarR family transcriptional regulator [Pleionea sp. CnH1-48]
MSTRLTQKGTPMVDSLSLQLVFSASKLQEQISDYLANSLKSKGYESASPTVLNFLSALDCGVNYGSEIARNLGVSRQMVAKTVKELCRVGYLEQVAGVGKQKQILFTQLGENLISDARQLLADLDKKFMTEVNDKKLQETLDSLNQLNTLLLDSDKQ